MDAREFEQHIAGAVNAFLRDKGNPTIVVTVLEGTKLDVLLQCKAAQRAAMEKARQDANGGARIVGLDGEALGGNWS